MEKIISIDGKDVKFKATGATVRKYRQTFGKDLLLGMTQLQKAFEKNELDSASLETFENLAYIMAKQADDSIPNTADEWLDGFTMFSIYEVFPQIIDLWNVSTNTSVDAKKNIATPSAV